MSITPLMPVYPRCGVRPVRGEGAYLIGERGERYLDFASSIAVNLLGHGHPHLTKAIQDQAATLMHVSNLYGSPQGRSWRSGSSTTALPTRFSSPFGCRGGGVRDQAPRALYDSRETPA
jgi:acetylornithine/succinyldiaminopimelate/putrescine aminotransferase